MQDNDNLTNFKDKFKKINKSLKSFNFKVL